MVASLNHIIARQIEDAFADTPYPGDARIVKSGQAGEEVRQAFRGKSWQHLSVNQLTYHHVDLPVLTPEAFRFYLPAFMTAVLQHHDHVGTMPINVIHSLTPPDANMVSQLVEKQLDTQKYEKVQDFLARVSAFTGKERAAIRVFLESYRRLYPNNTRAHRHLNRALEFWKTR